MKTIYSILLFLAVSATTVFAQVGVGTTSPKGALDVTSPDSGMLVPRVQLTAFLTAAPVTNPQGPTLENGTLIYNIGPALPDNIAAGFYYWQVDRWVALAGTPPTTNTAWLTTGNAGTSSATNYVGTTDAVDLHFRTSGVNKFRIPAATNQLLGFGGTTASPTYSWDGNSSSGMFSGGANIIRFSTAGSARFQIPNANQVHGMTLGTAALPFYSFSNDTDIGVFSPGTNQLGFSTAGVSRFQIPAANQVHAMDRGTAALPFYSFSTDPNTGIFSSGADELNISTNGTEKVRVLATGQVGIGTVAPKTILETAGALSLNEGTALSLSNGVNSNIALGTTPFSMYRITGPTAAFSVTGIVPVTGANGQIVTIENTTAHTMTIVHQATSTAANQILCPGAKNLVLVGQYATVTLQYNASQNRWVVNSSVADVATSTSTHNTLDRAYDEGGAGAGRTIFADSGAVVISNNSADSGLEIINNSTTSGVSGQYNSVINDGTIGYVADVDADGVGMLIDHNDTNNPYSGLQVTNYSNNSTAAGIYANTMATAPALAVEGGNATNTIATPNAMTVTNFRTNGGSAIDAEGAIGIRSTSQIEFGSAYSGYLNAVQGAAAQFNGTGLAALTTSSLITGNHRFGVVSQGNLIGTYSAFTNNGVGAAFEGRMNSFAYSFLYAARVAGTNYGTYRMAQHRQEGNIIANVIGPGINATTVKKDDKTILMPAVSAPESLFQDYGTSKLENGRARITINPILTENILVDEEHPLKVFIQLEGDCNGVYVTNKSAEGFEVVELGKGTSNVSFSYSLVATRASKEDTAEDGSKFTVNYSGRFIGINDNKTETKLLEDKSIESKPVKKMQQSKKTSSKPE